MLDSFDAIDDAPVNIGDNEEDHASQHGGDEEFIEEVDVIDNGVVFGAGFVVAHPCGGEIGGDIGMAALAFDDQIIAQGNACLHVIHFGDVMHAVTVGADWFVGGLPGEFFFKEFYGCAMEIRHIGIEYVCGNSILVHDG